ncbi:hypothetical protein [Leptospira neocaledonica]|uniref:hypothetical protein n=1 Tax=Leptospira neocaledonica TaxID=2023192 RepID=UPI000F6540B6|nr:hypothetical protein [Leptospira neocaledonica]
MASSIPIVTLPKEISADQLRISEDSNVPKLVGRSQVPVGKIYDISLAVKDKDGKETEPNRNSSFVFSEPAKFEFPVDLESLNDNGFSQELYVWYKDYVTKEWKLLEKGTLDKEKSTVTVHTNHFTPFILTALPVLPDTGVAAPTACLTEESASWGIQGVLDDSNVSKAQIGTIGEGYQTYLDRPYFVKENEGAFRELGFQFAAFIPTCQGDVGSCGSSSIHSESSMSEYVSFNAVQDIDIYVMYDARAGFDSSDSSNDADWLRTDFTLLPGKFIYTTDPGTDPAQSIRGLGYKVYKRSYLQGSRVVLGGNKKGTTPSLAGSNFWVVVKPKNTEGTSVSSGLLCASGPDLKVSYPVSVKFFPGATQNLFWFSYSDTNAPRNIIVRRSQISPPMIPTQGEEASGTEITPYSYLDSGLAIDTTYYYSVFSLNNDGIYNGITTASVTTSADTDGDGLSDITETSTSIRPLFIGGTSNTFMSSVNTDTDGDGVDDFTELSLGTDPTMADTVLPNVTFTLLSDNASSNFVDFTASVSDTNPAGTVKKYCYIRQLEAGMTKAEFERQPFGALSFGPFSGSSLNTWKENCYESKTFVQLGKAAGGPEKVAIWAKDGAGNVSNIKKYEFKQWEAKDTSWLGVTNISYDTNGNAASSFTDFTYLNYSSQWEDNTWTQKYTNLGLKNQIKFTNGGGGIAYKIPNFIAIGNGSLGYYDNSNVVGSLGSVSSISHNYTDVLNRFKAVSFSVNVNSNEVTNIVYLNQNNRVEIDMLSFGSFGPVISTPSYPEITASPLFVMPFDRGLGLLIGHDTNQYEFLHNGNNYLNLNTNGLANPNFNSVISADSLVRYNPQDEQEVIATLKSVPSREIKVWYKKSGDLTYNSIIPSGIESGTNFIGRQIKFLSYMDWSGNPVYTLYILGGYDAIVGQNTTYNLLRSYRVTFTGGVPSLQFIRESVIGAVSIDSISFDDSGRLMFAKGSSQRFISLFLNSNTGFKDISFIYNNQSSGAYTHLALSPSDKKGVGNVGGYSKLRLIQNAGWADYKKYGFLPEGSSLEFVNNFYDLAGNDCATSSSDPGVGTVQATAGGNYGIPPVSLTVNPGSYPRFRSVIAPNLASTLILQSSFTQGTSPCRDILVATDKAEIPVRSKLTKTDLIGYKDTTMTPANVPASMEPPLADRPVDVKNADFSIWEPLNRFSARMGRYTAKRWLLPGLLETGYTCDYHDVTEIQGMNACDDKMRAIWGWVPGSVRAFSPQYDQYTYMVKYTYSGDKLVPPPTNP